MRIYALITTSFLFAQIAFAENQNAFNDYPTEARADFVFGCMAVNGQTREALRQCSCSIDHIAQIISYDNYVEAETVLSLSREGGPRMSMFKTASMPQQFVKELRAAQAEAEMICFSTF